MLQQGIDLLIFFSLMVRSTENRDNRRSVKARILEICEMDGNWKALAENLSIPKTTHYRWISKGNQPDKRGGPRNCKVKQVYLDFIQALVEDAGMRNISQRGWAPRPRLNSQENGKETLLWP